MACAAQTEFQEHLGLQTAAWSSCCSWRSRGALPSPHPELGTAGCARALSHCWHLTPCVPPAVTVPGTTLLWGHQPAQLLLQRFRAEIKAGIVRFPSAQHFCSDTFLRPWAEDPNKMMVLFLSSRIIWAAPELLGASISQQKIEILCLSRNIFTSLLKNNGSFILWPQQDKKSNTITTGL